MRLEQLFEKWIGFAQKDSEYIPLNTLNMPCIQELARFYPQLLHLIFQQLILLQAQPEKTAAVLAQMKVCMSLAERILSYEIETRRFFHTLFSKNPAGKSLYDLMLGLKKLKAIEGKYLNQAKDNHIRLHSNNWIPLFYPFWGKTSAVGFIQEAGSLFTQGKQALTLQDFCNQAYIVGLNNTIASETTVYETYSYLSSPISYYQQKRQTYFQFPLTDQDTVPISKIRQAYNPGIIINRTITEKYQKDGITMTTAASLDTIMPELLDPKQFQKSPLSKHSNFLLWHFDYHGNTQTVQTLFKEAKKDLIRKALNYPLDKEGLGKIGVALKGLLEPNSNAIKIIRRPLDKLDYTGWFSGNTDTASYTLIKEAIDALYLFPGGLNDYVDLNNEEPLLKFSQRTALNALAQYIGNDDNPFSPHSIIEAIAEHPDAQPLRQRA